MKEKEIFLRAAELIDSGKENYSCWAILNAMGNLGAYLEKDHLPALRRYIKTFNGKRPFLDFACRVVNAVSSSSESGVGWPKVKKDQSNFRVLMLLFMAEACGDL